MIQTDSSITSVLVIDDTPANLGVVVEQLESFNYRVLIAQDGEEGFERAILAQPDIILLDVLLPGADGFEICRRLKADKQTKDIPVIFMTALSALDDKLTGFEVGGVDYITKPLRISEVLSRVKVHIELRRAKKKACEQNQLLQKHKQTLETQVAERTAELTQSNENLRKEIAERKRIQRILEDKESKYRSLVENTPDTICRYDRACRRLFVNSTFVEKIDGNKSMEQLLHTTPTEIPGGEEAIAYQKKIAQVFSSGKGEHFELTWKAINGKQFVTYIRLTPEFDDAGRIRSVLA
ncbi:MAG: response regulator, partial [Methylococcales bacterium]|nr:response regulator [Methylococcales bacterium]